MDSPSQFSPLDPSTYKWKYTPHAGKWRRAALAAETLWIPRPKDCHEMFIGGSLILESRASSSKFTGAARAAWRRLRLKVPELVATAGYTADGKAYMQYQTPTSEEQVNQWVERTTKFECGKQNLTFHELLEKIREKREECDLDQAFFLFHQVLVEEDGLVKRIDFILNTDHQITDGIGIRILLNRFLTILTESLGDPLALLVGLDWEESKNNLSPPWISLMNGDQLLSGLDYERVARANEDFLLRKLPLNPGLPLLSRRKAPTQRTHFITLTSVQTKQLLNATKTTINPEAKITHLGHAAMVLALVRSRPPPSYSQTLYSPCWLNGRRYLKPFASHPKPTTSYIPICQSFAPVVFDDLDSLVLARSASRMEVRERLRKACSVATRQYKEIKERKSILPECVLIFERLGRNMYLRQQQELRSKDENSAAAPPTQNGDPDASHPRVEISVSPNGKDYNYRSRTADPFFLSDGITEQYINHEYFDKSKQRTFVVDDILFAASAEKNLIVRMSSWRGKITLSGEWRDCDYDGDMVIRFLEDLIEIMLSVLDES